MNPQLAYYEIHIKDHLDCRWADWFTGFAVVNMCEEAGPGEAVLVGPVADQAALHGVLAAIRDLNLTLISVNRIDCHDSQTDVQPDE